MSENTSSTGIRFTGLLTLIFIVLKLIDKIDWSWWWVLSPLWIDIGLFIVIVLFWFIFRILLKK